MGSGAQMEVLALDEVTGRKMAVGQREWKLVGVFGPPGSSLLIVSVFWSNKNLSAEVKAKGGKIWKLQVREEVQVAQ